MAAPARDIRRLAAMLPVEEALELVARHSAQLAPRRVELGEATGLVLAEDITSDVDSPPYDKSLMDGYAVRSSDGEPLRQVLEEIAAGAVPRLPVTPGTASRIMTGAPLPEGADAVVALEQTELVSQSEVRLLQAAPRSGQHLLRRGTALRAGDLVLQRGAVVRPIEIAILAEIGRQVVNVQPRPRIAVLPTGNEVVPINEKPGRGQIRNSNGPMLVAAATRVGADALELEIARDDRGELSRLVAQGLVADMLVLSGGVSAGKFDLVPQVLAELGVEQVFHKVALRPGKPLWFGIKHDGNRKVPVFGLPGNPMSSLVCFELFVRPSVAALAGRGFVGPESVSAQLTQPFDYPGGRTACLPARLVRSSNISYQVEIVPWQGSADMASLARANGLAYIPPEKRQFAAGESLDVLRLS